MTPKHHPRIERLRKRMIQWNAKRVGSNGSCVLGIIVGTKGGDPKDRIQKKAGRNPLLWVWWGWSVMFTNLFDWEVEVRCSRKVVSFFHHHQTHICKDLATDSVDFSVFTAITRGQTFPSGWLGFCSCVLAAKNLWVSFISYHTEPFATPKFSPTNSWTMDTLPKEERQRERPPPDERHGFYK